MAIDATREMYEITFGEHEHFTIPVLDFRGTPLGIDVRKVMETGILPQINTGIAGQVNLGQAAFMGVGAYTTALLASKLSLPFWLALPLSADQALVPGSKPSPSERAATSGCSTITKADDAISVIGAKSRSGSTVIFVKRCGLTLKLPSVPMKSV